MGKKREKLKAPYKSSVEQQLGEGVLKDWDYEGEDNSIQYLVPHTYTPDFTNKKFPNILIEVKGRFRTYGEAQKYLAIKTSNPTKEIIFVFSRPETRAYPQCRMRKDGTYLTLKEWAEKAGFRWFTPITIKAIL